MPSGSGGHGGGGSHFGGGGGSHFSGGGRGGSGGSRPPRPIYFGFGGTRYYVPLKKSNAIRSFFVLAIFFVVVAAVLMLGGFAPNKDLKKITADRQRYIEMINRAEKDSSYVREGTITGTFTIPIAANGISPTSFRPTAGTAISKAILILFTTQTRSKISFRAKLSNLRSVLRPLPLRRILSIWGIKTSPYPTTANI